MIDFACKTTDLPAVVRCSLGLTKAEYGILLASLKSGEFTVEELSKTTRHDRTTVQKCLSKLLDKGLVKRIQKNREAGGYTFLYTAQQSSELKRQVKETIAGWALQAQSEVDSWTV